MASREIVMASIVDKNKVASGRERIAIALGDLNIGETICAFMMLMEDVTRGNPEAREWMRQTLAKCAARLGHHEEKN